MAANCIHHAHAFQRECKTEVTTRDGRLSLTDVVNILGARRDRIRRWVMRGWLRAEMRIVANSPLYVFDEKDILRFLFNRGALLADINPNHEWAPQVQQARKVLLRASVEHQALAKQLGLVSGYLAELRETKGFPNKFISKGWQNKTFYHRSDVYRWLEEHPSYDQRGTVRRWLNTYEGDFL